MDFKVGRFVVFCICCAVATTAIAQRNEIASRHYSMNDGLPDEGINSVVQDSLGFIWLGTWSGLCKFDGYRFTNYRNNHATSNGLGSNLINSLAQDEKGRLWIAHTQGIDLLDPKTEKFLLHWPQGSNKLYATRIVKGRNAKFWICTNAGVFLADSKTLSIDSCHQFPTNTHAIGETSDGSIAYVSNEIFHYVDSKTGTTVRFEHDPLNPKSIGDPFAWNVIVDKKDRIWIATYNSIELFNPIEKSFTHYPTKNKVLTMLENDDGSFLIGCANGVFTFNPEKGKTMDRIADYYHPRSIIRDDQGNVWAATLKGLLQLYSKRAFNVSEKLGTGIGHIMEGSDNEIWVLGLSKYHITRTLYKFNLSTGAISRRTTNFPDSTVRSFFKDSSGNVWIVSSMHLEKYDPKSYTTEVFHLDSRKKNAPNTTIMDSNGVIWMGGWNGVSNFNPVTGAYEKLSTFPHSVVYSFLEDTNRNLWIASHSGLARYNLKSGSLDFFNSRPDDPQSLSGNVVYHLIMDSDKNIWVGTNGGLNKMIKGTENSTPRFISWQASLSGLANDDVYCIVDGGDRTLWISCGNMISHFYPEQNIFRNYNNNDGLSGRSFKGLDYANGKGIRSHNGTILFGSVGGLVIFHPDSLKDNQFVPPVVISNFSIQNQRVPVRGTAGDTLTWRTPLTNSITHTKEIRLTHKQNDFDFEFAALNYINPGQNKYKYKLEPYQKEWIETSASNRVASYTNIDPGKYAFHVIGSNNDGIWNEKGTSIMIIISPPWWKTWWAYALYALTITSVFLYWRTYEIKSLSLKHQAEHLRQLDQLKTRFFTNISHEFRTPITLILGPLKELYDKASNKEERSMFELMLRNGKRLSHLINQVLDLSKLEAGKMSLHAEEVDIVQFLREIVSVYESLALSKGVKYYFNPDASELNVYVDKEKMEKVVHNLLSNAFKFTNENGEVVLSLRSQGGKCLIILRDTGIGISPNNIDKIFDRFYQVDGSQTRGYEGSGLGMALSKELVDLHHGTITVESVEGKGTTFTVAIPLGRDQFKDEEIIAKEDRTPSHFLIDETLMSPDQIDNVKIIEPTELPIVMIVEDNADMRHYIRKTLLDHYQILEATNGKEGLEISKEVIPDLIISDVMMPEMDGYKFCSQIKTDERTSHIPVILLTAKADHQSRMEGLETGADDYLSKPFHADELNLLVKNRIDQRKKIRERFSHEVIIGPKQIAITSMDERFLTKVLAIIEGRMDDEGFSIEELSREAGFSNMHFYRKIKALTGTTPSDFLRTIRLKRAAELLRKKADNVTQIAYSVGFSSLSYFNKSFKKQFGMTPGQFSGKNSGT